MCGCVSGCVWVGVGVFPLLLFSLPWSPCTAPGVTAPVSHSPRVLLGVVVLVVVAMDAVSSTVVEARQV